MKYTTLNVSFYCRPCKASKKGVAPIELSLIINGERAYITLPRKENPATFKKCMEAKRTNSVKEYVNAGHSAVASMAGRLSMCVYRMPTRASTASPTA